MSLLVKMPRQPASAERVAREWLVTFAELYRVSLTERGPRFVDIWVGALSDLEPEVLEAACEKSVRTYKFFPAPAEVRALVDKTQETAVAQAAEIEWQRVLGLRRRYWDPDMPGGFSRGMPKLSERVDRAARASGVFTLQDCGPEAIHVWGKKRFIESYIAWATLEQDQFLLPDGELKNLLANAAGKKQLPAKLDAYQAGREAGEKHRDKIATLTAMVSSMTGRPASSRPIVVPQSRWELLQKQRAELLAKSTPEQIREAERLRSL
jgi:hypothetical protein